MMIARTAMLVAIAMGGCSAPKDTISLTAGDKQEAIIRDGVPALVSSKRNVVFMRPASSLQGSSDRPRFVVAMLNKGRQPATLRTADIDVRSIRPAKARLRVYSQTELAEEVESQRNAQLIVGALAGAAGAYSAAQSGYSQTTGSYTRNSPYGTSYGSYSATTYNPAAAQAALNANADRTAWNMASIEGQAQDRLQELQATILKDHTVMPGEWHGGVIVFDAPAKADTGAAEYTITLQFDGEEHSFSVMQQRRA